MLEETVGEECCRQVFKNCCREVFEKSVGEKSSVSRWIYIRLHSGSWVTVDASTPWSILSSLFLPCCRYKAINVVAAFI